MFPTLVYGGTAALFTLSAIAHLLHMFHREFDQVARWSTRVAWVIQTAGFLLLLATLGRVPIQTLFEFAFSFSWLMMTNYVVVEYIRGDQGHGSFLIPVVAAVTIFANTLPKPTAESIVEELPASLIVWHVAVSLLGYAFFIASFIAGGLYLFQERNLRRKKWGPMYYKLPSLETLDIWSGRFVYVGFPLMTIGVASGLGFAHFTWETFWQSDPKVTFTVLVWLVYFGYLLMRKVWGWGGRKAAWWSVAGATGLLINYFVINLLSRLHRFGV